MGSGELACRVVTASDHAVVERRDGAFTTVGGVRCRGWLYLPAGSRRPPVVVLGHGAGDIREMRLDAYAERFVAAGVAALAFTHRHFGDSDGEPRQLLSVRRQLEDWDAALGFVASRPRSTARGPRSGVRRSAGDTCCGWPRAAGRSARW